METQLYNVDEEEMDHLLAMHTYAATFTLSMIFDLAYTMEWFAENIKSPCFCDSDMV